MLVTVVDSDDMLEVPPFTSELTSDIERWRHLCLRSIAASPILELSSLLWSSEPAPVPWSSEPATVPWSSKPASLPRSSEALGDRTDS